MKKERLLLIAKAVGFLVLGMVLLLRIQSILSRKWYYPVYIDPPADMLEEFYEVARHTDIQTVFLGASHPEYGIDPMAIYESSGIVSFNLSLANQSLASSYFLCAEALKHSNPEIVLFDVSKLSHNEFNATSETWYRAILDNVPFSLNMVDLALEYTSHYSEGKQAGSFLGTFFPIYRYHDRWTELSAVDFEQPETQNCYRKGYYLSSRINACDISIEWMNEQAEMLSKNVGWTHSIIGGMAADTTEDSLLYETTVDEAALSFLKAMKQLCDEHNAKLVLIKIPTISNPQYEISAWTRLRSEAMKELAAEYGLEFLDLFYDVDLGINWNRGTLDGGYHLNLLSASKVSAFLADYLQDTCGLVGAKCDVYEQDLPIYYAVRSAAESQMIEDIPSYLNALSQLEHVTVFLSVADDMMSNLSSEDRQALKEFGLQTDFDSMGYSDAFLAVIENGITRCELSSNRYISEEGVLSNGQSYLISSCGWLVGSESKIIVDGTNHSLNHRGINIVVLDNESGLVLDSVAFDTWDVPNNQSAIRDNSKTENYLRKYEQYLMIQDAKNGIGG